MIARARAHTLMIVSMMRIKGGVNNKQTKKHLSQNALALCACFKVELVRCFPLIV